MKMRHDTWILKLGCLMLLLAIASCIVRVPNRGKTDYSGTFEIPKSAYFNYQEIDAQTLKQRIHSSDSVLVVFFAAWCPYSYQKIKSLQYMGVDSSNTYFISSNYDFPSMEKHFAGKLPMRTIYLIRPFETNQSESAKLRSFISKIGELHEDSISGGVPQHLLFKNGQLVKHTPAWPLF